MIKFPQFMYGEKICPRLCDDIVQIFESAPGPVKKSGVVGMGEVDTDIKDSLDIASVYYMNNHSEVINQYYGQLSLVLDSYEGLYPYVSKDQSPVYIEQPHNVQRYLPGQGFKRYHCEEDGSARRHLVFMTYLNDVEDGGTHWLHQDFHCPAVKGLTIIWPAQWMFAHKGIISYTKNKYIITGWYRYVDPQENQENKLYQ